MLPGPLSRQLSPLTLGLLLALATPAPVRADAPEAANVEPAPQLALPLLRVPEVSVTATRSERDILEVPGNVTVIDRATIERSGARDAADLLRREAGLFVTSRSYNPEGHSIEARGFNNGGGNGAATLVLLDGRRLNEESSTFTDWSFVPPLAAIERIEITRGPASAVYGDNAIAGVIEIFTRKGEPGSRAVLSGRTGTFDTDAGTLWAGGGDERVRASAFVDGWKTHGYRERSNFRTRRGQLQIEGDLSDRVRLAVSSGYTSDKRQRPGDLSDAEIRADRRQSEVGRDFDDVRERWAQASIDVGLSQAVGFSVRSWVRRRSEAGLSSDPDPVFGFDFGFDNESDSAGLTSQAQIDTSLGGLAQRLLVGMDLLQQDSDQDSSFSSPGFSSTFSRRSRRKTYAFFVQHEIHLREDLLLSAGVRRDRMRYRDRDRGTSSEFTAKASAWAPKAALTWRVRPDTSLYASWARGFRFPNVDERFGFLGGGPGLDTQKSGAWEVGARVHSQRGTFNFAAYTMDVKQEIIFDPDAPNPLSPFGGGVNVNLDRVRHRGFEVSGTLRPLPWLEVYGSYTFDDTRILRQSGSGLEGHRLPITPEHRGTWGLRAALPLGFELGVNANYVGSRELANDLANDLDKLSKFATYDARAGWRRALGEHVELLLEVDGYNLTGRRYNEFGGRGSFSPSIIGYFPNPERHWVVGARITVTP